MHSHLEKVSVTLWFGTFDLEEIKWELQTGCSGNPESKASLEPQEFGIEVDLNCGIWMWNREVPSWPLYVFSNGSCLSVKFLQVCLWRHLFQTCKYPKLQNRWQSQGKSGHRQKSGNQSSQKTANTNPRWSVKRWISSITLSTSHSTLETIYCL